MAHEQLSSKEIAQFLWHFLPVFSSLELLTTVHIKSIYGCVGEISVESGTGLLLPYTSKKKKRKNSPESYNAFDL